MPNSYTLPIQGNDAYVDINGYTSGRSITYELLKANAELLNYSFAYLGTGPIINEQYNAGVFYYNSTSQRTVARWLVPTLSGIHSQFKFTVRARGGTPSLNGIISWDVVSSNGTTSSNHTPFYQVNYTYTNVLTITVASTNTLPYFEIRLKVQNQVDIQSIMVEHIPLATPISTATLSNCESDNTRNNFYGISPNMFNQDTPLSSSKAKQMADNIETLNKRPKLLFNMSGIDTGITSTTNPYNAYTIRPQKGLLWDDISNITRGDILLPYWFNSENMDVYFNLHLYIQPLADFVLYFLDQEINIPNTNAEKWVSYRIKYNTSSLFEIASSSMGTPLIRYRILPLFPNSLPVTATPILAMSLWGV